MDSIYKCECGSTSTTPGPDDTNNGMCTYKLDTDSRYTVKGYEGVAWSCRGYAQTWEPLLYVSEDEDGNEYEEDTGEGEWQDDTDKVIMVMVGDDRKFTFDIEDITKLNDLDYCQSCGQVGCTHDGRMRDS